ncbi:hypothetical protein OG308_27160 [Nocardia salmonicida]|uniref:Uncharacterized protein n=1 Tax=Nocardia salmonicida TaxID=53431 RepID=A0ABZ1N4X0_9NOCA
MTEEPGRFRVEVVGEDGEEVGEFVVRDRSVECRAAVDHLLPGIDAVESGEQCPVVAGAHSTRVGSNSVPLRDRNIRRAASTPPTLSWTSASW